MCHTVLYHAPFASPHWFVHAIDSQEVMFVAMFLKTLNGIFASRCPTSADYAAPIENINSSQL